ncbi:MAG: WbqC family protein [Candidatus Azobacteroides sp.]|nr:WbqC family protein [Candidatus Azobacteroides sp.]
MSTCFLTSFYLAPIQYYSKLYHYDKVIVEKYCHYTKQTYRNRCHIASANGKLALTIPVEKLPNEKQFTKDVRISYHINWQHLHWNAIISAYNSSPFFEFYEDELLPFYEKKYKYLFDFNEELRIKMMELLQIDKKQAVFSEFYEKNINIKQIDFRDTIHPKKSFNFDADFNIIPYYQVFIEKLSFIPNLSIIDLLFNTGPESLIILSKSHQ